MGHRCIVCGDPATQIVRHVQERRERYPVCWECGKMWCWWSEKREAIDARPATPAPQ